MDENGSIQKIIDNQAAHEKSDNERFGKGEKQFGEIKVSLDKQDGVLGEIKKSLTRIETVLALPLFASKYPKTTTVVVIAVIILIVPSAAKTIIEFFKAI